MLTLSRPRLPLRKGNLLRKGWCPGALAPMPAKDGLLVRLRVSGGVLPSPALRRLASAGRAYGNGIFELTSRGNLQMRGVTQASQPSLIGILADLGLIDEDARAEAIRNVLVSPLSGLGGAIDAAAIGKALESALVQDEALRGLPAKFGFLIDDGGPLPLAHEPADVRFDFCADRNVFAIGLGGTAQSAVPLGVCEPGGVAGAALSIARAFLRLGGSMGEPLSRMRELVRMCSAAMIAEAAGLRLDPAPRREPRPEASPIGAIRLGGGLLCLGAGAPFGRLSAEMLAGAAGAADAYGCGEIRLTPWRALILPRVAKGREDALRAHLSALNFITDSEDPRLAVAACIGAAGCDHGGADTQADAGALTPIARHIAQGLRGGGVALHVSGCEKGCARQAVTPYTLVAKANGYDLIIDGTPGGDAVAKDLSVTTAAALLASFEEKAEPGFAIPSEQFLSDAGRWKRER